MIATSRLFDPARRTPRQEAQRWALPEAAGYRPNGVGPRQDETGEGQLNPPVTGSTSNKRESYSIPLTTTPHAPRRMDTPEKRYTQTGRAPESKNVNPNRFAKSTSVLRGRYPQPCLCRPPVMKPTSVVLAGGGYWTVPLLGGKGRFSARAPEPFETGGWGRIQGQSPGLGEAFFGPESRRREARGNQTAPFNVARVPDRP